MSTEYRVQAQYNSAEEEKTSSSSSSSGDDFQAIVGVISSPSSDYLIQSFLGQGVFGKVAKCIKSATKETVAVKMITKYFTAEAHNEVAVLKKLSLYDSDKFNFVQYKDSFMHREDFCIEFEMLDMSLWDLLDRKSQQCFSVKEIRPILHQMATTLQFLGSIGVVHSDLKPDNIMLVDNVNQPLKVKMIDFGLACHVSQTESGLYMQPRPYRSPEIILGHPYTPAIDMWSLGCIAAELFLGYILYPGSCEYEMLQHIMQTQGQLPQRILDKGSKTRMFFCRKKGRRHRWRLKTPMEYGVVHKSKSYFRSLDDLKKIKQICHLSDEDTKAEEEDIENFVELLKKMLHLDANKRLTPSLLLEDPFITMSDLTENYPDSFYTKSACEMMEICLDQSPSSNDMNQEPQPSTSTAGTMSSDQHSIPGTPVWQSHMEHPLVLEISSAVSRGLLIQVNQSPPEQLSLPVHDQNMSLEQQLASTAQGLSYTGTIRPVRKMKRTFSEASLSGDRPKEVPAEASSSKATAKPQRKRKWATLEPHDDSSKKKILKMSPLEDSEEAPSVVLSTEAKKRPQRKRTWATFVATHSGLRKPSNDSPVKKMRKMSPLKESEEAPTVAPSTEVKIKPQRKRTWDTFVALHSGLRKPLNDSPVKKMRKMSPLKESEEVPTVAPSTEVKIKPQRKRTWDTFVASHSGLRKPLNDSPERKIMKMSQLAESKEAPTVAPSTAAKTKPQRKRTWATFAASNPAIGYGSPDRKRRKLNPLDESKEAPTVALSTAAKTKPQRKRTWATFAASNPAIGYGSSDRKRRKWNPLDESKEAPTVALCTAKVKPQRKRSWATFVASHPGISYSSPELKKRKMSQIDESEEDTMDEMETQAKKKRCNSDQASSSQAKSPEINNKNPDGSSTKKKERKKSSLVKVAHARSLKKRTTEDHGGPLRTMEDHRGPWRTMENHDDNGEQQTVMDNAGGPRRTTEDHGGPRRTAEDHGGPRRTTEDHGGPRRTTEDRRGPQRTTEDHDDTGGQQTATNNAGGPWRTAEDHDDNGGQRTTREDRRGPWRTIEDHDNNRGQQTMWEDHEEPQ